MGNEISAHLLANLPQKKKGKPRGRPFQKGQVANPRGRPADYGEFRKLCRSKSPQAVATLEAALDALNGVAWQDDSQVVELHALRLDDKHSPRLEVDVRPWQPREEACASK